MDITDLTTRLRSLQRADLDTVILAIPGALPHVSKGTPAQKITELLEWAISANRLVDVAQALARWEQPSGGQPNPVACSQESPSRPQPPRTVTPSESTPKDKTMDSAPTVKLVEPKCESVKIEICKSALGIKPVLLMTAVTCEMQAVRSLLRPLSGREHLLLCAHGQETYWAGLLGAYPVVLTMCRSGATGRDGVIGAALDAITTFEPCAVIMAGMAFGVNPAKQCLGTVLISSQVIPYEILRVSEHGIIERGSRPDAGATLLNRFSVATADWTGAVLGREVKAEVGPILAGEKLVDNSSFKADLLRRFQNAIGGEMEGAGLYAAAARKNIEWIVIKGIADWADGSKTKEWQPFAALAAATLVEKVLQDPHSLASLGATAAKLNAQTGGNKPIGQVSSAPASGENSQTSDDDMDAELRRELTTLFAGQSKLATELAVATLGDGMDGGVQKLVECLAAKAAVDGLREFNRAIREMERKRKLLPDMKALMRKAVARILVRRVPPSEEVKTLKAVVKTIHQDSANPGIPVRFMEDALVGILVAASQGRDPVFRDGSDHYPRERDQVDFPVGETALNNDEWIVRLEENIMAKQFGITDTPRGRTAMLRAELKDALGNLRPRFAVSMETQLSRERRSRMQEQLPALLLFLLEDSGQNQKQEDLDADLCVGLRQFLLATTGAATDEAQMQEVKK